MKQLDIPLLCLMMLIIASISPLLADTNPNPYSCVIDTEFANTDLVYAPLAAWASAGSNAVIDSVYTINVTAIPDTIYIQGTFDPIPDAQTGDSIDNSLTFNNLIVWLSGRSWLQGIHAQIYIPPGVYNFSDIPSIQKNTRKHYATWWTLSCVQSLYLRHF